MRQTEAPSFCEQKDCPSGEAKKLYYTGAWVVSPPLTHPMLQIQKSFCVPPAESLFSKNTACFGTACLD
jgi:hypothetical protein